MEHGILVAVSVGRARRVQRRGRSVDTAIFKTPVEGRVAVRGVNVEGDEQADPNVHGGSDKAVLRLLARGLPVVECAARPSPVSRNEQPSCSLSRA